MWETVTSFVTNLSGISTAITGIITVLTGAAVWLYRKGAETVRLRNEVERLAKLAEQNKGRLDVENNIRNDGAANARKQLRDKFGTKRRNF